MATQTSQLISNLQNIYSEKLLIKQAIPTTSDDFMMYHTYIAALHPSGTSYISANGLSDVSSYQFAYVTVEGGESGDSSSIPEQINRISEIYDVLESETLPYSDNILLVEINNTNDNYTLTDTGEVEEEDTIYNLSFDQEYELYDEENDDVTYKTVHFLVNTVFEDPFANFREDGDFIRYDEDGTLKLELNLYLYNVQISETEDPSNDGYDYLVEADSIWATNLYESTSIGEISSLDGVHDTGSNYNIVNLYKNLNYHIFNLQSQIIPVASSVDIIDINDIMSYQQVITHNAFEVNYFDPNTNETTTNSYYDFSCYYKTGNVYNVVPLISSGVYGEGYETIEVLEYADTNQTSSYVDEVRIFENTYSTELDPDTGDTIGVWNRNRVQPAGSSANNFHFFELEPGDTIYMSTAYLYYEMSNTYGFSFIPYKGHTVIDNTWNGFSNSDNIKYPYNSGE